MRSRKAVVKELDRVFGDYIKARDKRCVVCGSTDRPQCGHLFSRIAYSTRWNPMNAYQQCAGCNFRHESDFMPLLDYANRTHGTAKIRALHRLYETPVQYKTFQLEEMIRYWREQGKEVT